MMMMRTMMRTKVCIDVDLLLSTIHLKIHCMHIPHDHMCMSLADDLERAMDDDEDDEEDEEGEDDEEEAAPALVSRPQARQISRLREISPSQAIAHPAWDR